MRTSSPAERLAGVALAAQHQPPPPLALVGRHDPATGVVGCPCVGVRRDRVALPSHPARQVAPPSSRASVGRTSSARSVHVDVRGRVRAAPGPPASSVRIRSPIACRSGAGYSANVRRSSGSTSVNVSAGMPISHVVDQREQLPVVDEQQPAAGQEPLHPGRGPGRRHADGEHQAHPAGHLVGVEAAAVEQQPGHPPGQQAVQVVAAGQALAACRATCAVSVGVAQQAERRVDPVQAGRASRPRRRRRGRPRAAGSPTQTRTTSPWVTAASELTSVPRTSP